MPDAAKDQQVGAAGRTICDVRFCDRMAGHAGRHQTEAGRYFDDPANLVKPKRPISNGHTALVNNEPVPPEGWVFYRPGSDPRQWIAECPCHGPSDDAFNQAFRRPYWNTEAEARRVLTMHLQRSA